MKKNWLNCGAICVVFGLFLALGCEKSENSAPEREEDGDHEHGDPDPTCEAISAACHDVEELSGQALWCHELAHDNDASTCEQEEMGCTQHCMALAASGGAGGEGGAHD